MARVRVRAFDHLVLVVADVERSLAWYCGELGLEGVRVDEWRRGEAPFPSARVNADTILDFVPRGSGAPAGRNVDHFCLVVDAVDLDALAASGEFDVAGGPFDLFGARGVARAVYVRDPDGHTVELRCYP
jgi:catechol 2,3-dioxygenase-like lactoylglutathione lyase family enzyme